MLAVVIAGAKKSGKTALLALVAEALERRGKSVAIIKSSNHPLEKSNTDAFWFMREGRAVVHVSPEETAMYWARELDFAEITARLRTDVVLCEGGNVPVNVPRILCFKESAEEMEFPGGKPPFPVIATYGEQAAFLDIPHVEQLDPSAAETLASLVLEKGANVASL